MGGYQDAKFRPVEVVRLWCSGRLGPVVSQEVPLIFKGQRQAVVSDVTRVADIVRDKREVDVLAENRRVDADGVRADWVVGSHEIHDGDIRIGVGRREDERRAGLRSFGHWRCGPRQRRAGRAQPVGNRPCQVRAQGDARLVVDVGKGTQRIACPHNGQPSLPRAF